MRNKRLLPYLAMRAQEKKEEDKEQMLSSAQRKKRLEFRKLARILVRGLISMAPVLGLKGFPGVLLSFLGYFGKQVMQRRGRPGVHRSFLPRGKLKQQDEEW